MPGKTDDDQREDQTEDEESEDQDETEDTEGTEDSEESEGTEGSDDKSKSKAQKRISDLQSKADAAEARANKAEQALTAKVRGAGSEGGDPATKALMAELREASLDAIYGEFPEFKDFAIDRSSIEGTTRAELRESAVSLVGLIRSVKTKVRNQVLTENGLKAEPSGSNRVKPVDYGSMSDEAFQKVLDSVS